MKKGNGEQILLTKEEAISALPPGDRIHTFMEGGPILAGCDMDRDKIIELFSEQDGNIHIGGDSCKGLKHALVVKYSGDWLFIESNMEVIKQLEEMQES